MAKKKYWKDPENKTPEEIGAMIWDKLIGSSPGAPRPEWQGPVSEEVARSRGWRPETPAAAAYPSPIGPQGPPSGWMSQSDQELWRQAEAPLAASPVVGPYRPGAYRGDPMAADEMIMGPPTNPMTMQPPMQTQPELQTAPQGQPPTNPGGFSYTRSQYTPFQLDFKPYEEAQKNYDKMIQEYLDSQRSEHAMLSYEARKAWEQAQGLQQEKLPQPGLGDVLREGFANVGGAMAEQPDYGRQAVIRTERGIEQQMDVRRQRLATIMHKYDQMYAAAEKAGDTVSMALLQQAQGKIDQEAKKLELAATQHQFKMDSLRLQSEQARLNMDAARNQLAREEFEWRKGFETTQEANKMTLEREKMNTYDNRMNNLIKQAQQRASDITTRQTNAAAVRQKAIAGDDSQGAAGANKEIFLGYVMPAVTTTRDKDGNPKLTVADSPEMSLIRAITIMRGEGDKLPFKSWETIKALVRREYIATGYDGPERWELFEKGFAKSNQGGFGQLRRLLQEVGIKDVPEPDR